MSKLATELKTSGEWWGETKNDDRLLFGWLEKQYHGEVTAADRIASFADKFALPESREDKILRLIASQETDHAEWVGGLLLARGIEPVILEKPERYWDETLPGVEDFQTGAAVAAHAEHMRLERIRVISEDSFSPADIKDVFSRILPQEMFHERAFTQLAGSEAMQRTLETHRRGRVAIGLFPEDN